MAPTPLDFSSTSSVRSPTRLPIGPTPSSRADPLVSSLHGRESSIAARSTHLRNQSSATARTRSDNPPPPSPTSPSLPGIPPSARTQVPPGFLRQTSNPGPRYASPPPRPTSATSVSSGEHMTRTFAIDSDVEEEGEHSAAPALPFAPPMDFGLSTAGRPNAQKSREPLLPITNGTPQLQANPTGAPRSPERSAWRESVDRLFRRMSGSVDGHGAGGQALTFRLNEADVDEHDTPTTSPRTSATKTRRSFGVTPTVPFAPKKDEDLSNVPILASNGRPVLKWRLHPSNNTFFLSGRILTGGDQPYAFIASLALVLGISGVWFGTTCVWWWHNLSPAVAAVGAYMCLLTLSTMLATAFRDPGILPRGLDLDPPYPSGQSVGSNPAPLPREIRVRKGRVQVKYCTTCKTYRPPRSSHCKMCDNCVEGCDHHCQWVNNCVGHRNYTSFFAFLTSAVLTLALVIVTSAIHLAIMARQEGFKHAVNQGAGSAVAFSLGILVIWPITALAVYHIRLLLLNVTTIEQIRNTAHKTLVPGPAPPNPFSHGSWRWNLVNVLCRPAGYSWLDAHAPATEDKRAVNPGQKSSE